MVMADIPRIKVAVLEQIEGPGYFVLALCCSLVADETSPDVKACGVREGADATVQRADPAVVICTWLRLRLCDLGRIFRSRPRPKSSKIELKSSESDLNRPELYPAFPGPRRNRRQPDRG